MTLFSGSVDGEIRVWSLGDPDSLPPAANDQWHHVAMLTGHTNAVLDIVVKGSIVYSASTDATIKVWSATTASLLGTLCGHTDRVTALALGTGGAPAGRLWSASSDGLVKGWPLAVVNDVDAAADDGIDDLHSLVMSLPHPAGVLNLAVTPAATAAATVAATASACAPTRIFALCEDYTIWVWSAGGQKLQHFCAAPDPVPYGWEDSVRGGALEVSPNGLLLFSAGVVDAAMRVWTLNTAARDGDGTATGRATVVSAPPIRVLVTSELGYCTIEALAVAPSGHLYTAGADETVRLW